MEAPANTGAFNRPRAWSPSVSPQRRNVVAPSAFVVEEEPQSHPAADYSHVEAAMVSLSTAASARREEQWVQYSRSLRSPPSSAPDEAGHSSTPDEAEGLATELATRMVTHLKESKGSEWLHEAVPQEDIAGGALSGRTVGRLLEELARDPAAEWIRAATSSDESETSPAVD